jgi:ubiquinone/menaquinone biosynthesis C-methylase UbiE
VVTDYYTRWAAAFVRGSLNELPSELSAPPLAELDAEQCETLVTLGGAAGLRLHRFKRASQLPRVRKVLGTLRALAPDALLDVGTGRGVFLWALLDEFPELRVTCVDVLDYRVADLLTVRRGGVERLEAFQGSVDSLPFGDAAFPIVTMLEVLEHIPDPLGALREVCRVAERAVVLSVPSKEDDNPEHIHLFSPTELQKWLQQLGMRTVKCEGVLNHWVVLALR